jgi:hypothetical protein
VARNIVFTGAKLPVRVPGLKISIAAIAEA